MSAILEERNTTPVADEIENKIPIAQEEPESKDGSQLFPATHEVIAGLSAGCATTLMVHPLDLIKTRLQVQIHNTNKESRKIHKMLINFGTIPRLVKEIVRVNNSQNLTFTSIFRIQIKELYRGLGPNLLGSTISWGAYFSLYGTFKSYIHKTSPQGYNLSSTDYLICAWSAGSFTSFFTNPIWVLKTRILSTSASSPGAYASVLDGAKRIYKEEGVRAFWKGFGPSLFGVCQASVQFTLYEHLKSYALKSQTPLLSRIFNSTLKPGEDCDYNSCDSHRKWLTIPEYIAISASAKSIATVSIYPYQVVRSRLQRYDSSKLYKSALDCILKIYRTESLLAFYNGLAANLLRVIPSTCITFLVYEHVKQFLDKP
ncbi:mitochondrial carrier [Nadsonia fulvescens var. elongata DSM 6958]|uniref:Mitochondrial carrier n=1 Tax=Nadsonia fulvescens var. elongata DSM 6958 TaxID=857566 RepID=A0A1E3PKZ1_9ASCO|nr:mitochondrial carrier [Nadsonia fulvescens var. elongata DSM 6958]